MKCKQNQQCTGEIDMPKSSSVTRDHDIDTTQHASSSELCTRGNSWEGESRDDKEMFLKKQKISSKHTPECTSTQKTQHGEAGGHHSPVGANQSPTIVPALVTFFLNFFAFNFSVHTCCLLNIFAFSSLFSLSFFSERSGFVFLGYSTYILWMMTTAASIRDHSKCGDRSIKY